MKETTQLRNLMEAFGEDDSLEQWKDNYNKGSEPAPTEELTWGDELLEALILLLEEAQSAEDVVDGVKDLIQQYAA